MSSTAVAVATSPTSSFSARTSLAALPGLRPSPAQHATVPDGSLGRGIAFGLLLAVPAWSAIVGAVLLVLP